MKKSEDTVVKNKKPGDYSEPGIHDGDEMDAAGMKKKFDRGDPGEDKEDIIQKKENLGRNLNTDQPIDYTEPGFKENVPINSSGKLKFDRAAPEENPDAFQKSEHQTVLSSETSKPNYVEEEALRNKQTIVQQFSGKEEVEFLQGLVLKAESGGWKSPIIDEIKHRIEYLNGK